jgi:hypothetical protein
MPPLFTSFLVLTKDLLDELKDKQIRSSPEQKYQYCCRNNQAEKQHQNAHHISIADICYRNIKKRLHLRNAAITKETHCVYLEKTPDMRSPEAPYPLFS